MVGKGIETDCTCAFQASTVVLSLTLSLRSPRCPGSSTLEIIAGCPRFAPYFGANLGEKHSCGSAGSERFAILSGPFRLNLNHPYFSQGIMTKTAPFPLRGSFYQAPLHGIEMDVSQLLIEFCRVAKVAVIVPFLPERTRAAQPLGK